MAQAGRDSTGAVYDGKWKRYQDWCIARGYDALNPAGPQLADFFNHLSSVEGLAFSTLRGYKASILSVLSARHPLPWDIEKDLAKLFAFFSKARVDPIPLPSWNLTIVLLGFKRAPFEPIESIELKFLLQKTLFLVFLAAGIRRSEVLALSRKVLFRVVDGHSEAILSPVPGFVPKTRRGVSSNHPLVIRGLEGYVPQGEETFLCPIRALRVYLERTANIRDKSDRLFVPVSERSSGILSQHSLKSHLLAAIETSYRAVDENIPADFSLRVHDLRKHSFSLASAAGVSMEAILAAGRWRRSSTFTDYYLHSSPVGLDEWFTLFHVIYIFFRDPPLF
jgi:integrase